MQSTRDLRITSRATLFAVLLLLMFVLLPIWPYSSTWGSYPSLIVLALLAILGILFFRVTPRNL